MKKILPLFIFLSLALPIMSLAYSSSEGSGNLTAKITPTNAGPYEKVSVALTGYGFDLDNSQISWTLNGKQALYGRGEKNLTFTLGKIGQRIKIAVEVLSPQGLRFNKTLSIEPATVSLIWQSNTYTPPFYKGKALPTINSPIKVVAFPQISDGQGKLTDYREVSYRWSLDGTYLPNSSGLGKNYFLFDLESSGNKIEVEATVAKSQVGAKNSLFIAPKTPELLFYKKNHLTGVDYSQILPLDYALTDQEITLRAEPYFFYFKNWSDLFFSWLINNEAAPTGSKNNELTLRAKEGTQGVSQLNLKVRSGENDQEAGRTLTIKFGQKSFNF